MDATESRVTLKLKLINQTWMGQDNWKISPVGDAGVNWVSVRYNKLAYGCLLLILQDPIVESTTARINYVILTELPQKNKTHDIEQYLYIHIHIQDIIWLLNIFICRTVQRRLLAARGSISGAFWRSRSTCASSSLDRKIWGNPMGITGLDDQRKKKLTFHTKWFSPRSGRNAIF